MKQILTAVVTALLCSSGSHAATSVTHVSLVDRQGAVTIISLDKISGERTVVIHGATIGTFKDSDGNLLLDVAWTDVKVTVPCNGTLSAVDTATFSLGMACH